MVNKIVLIIFICLNFMGCTFENRKPNLLELDLSTCSGFQKNQKKQTTYWGKNFPIQYQVSDTELSEASEKATEIWNQALGFEAFRISDSQSLNKILFHKNWDESLLNPGSNILIEYDGAVYSSQIILNQENYDFGLNLEINKIDLISVLIHEMGHSLGLAHIDSTDSIMSESLSKGQVVRYIGDQDITNVLCAYVK